MTVDHVPVEIPVMQEESLKDRSSEGLLTETAIDTDSSCVIAVTEEFDKQAKIGGIHVAIDAHVGIILQSLVTPLLDPSRLRLVYHWSDC